jgi:hypothetical protein
VGDRATTASGSDDKPVIDVTAALGEAGHEVADLGYEGIPDDGAVLQDAGAPELHRDVDDALDVIVEQAPSD